MKKVATFILILILICTLTACGCKHEWVEASCETPKTCTLCEEVEGEPLGHSWQEATCETAKTCSACGLTEGDALGHDWVDATCETPKTCSICSHTEGDALGHRWNNADCQEEMICTTCNFASGEFGPHMDLEQVATMAQSVIIGCKCGQNEIVSAQDLMLRLLKGRWTVQAVYVDGNYYAPEPQTNWEEGTQLVFSSSTDPWGYQTGISDLGIELIIPYDLSDFISGEFRYKTNTDDTYPVTQCTALPESSDGSAEAVLLRLVLGSRDYNPEDYTTKDFLESALSGKLLCLWRFTDDVSYLYGYEAENDLSD